MFKFVCRKKIKQFLYSKYYKVLLAVILIIVFLWGSNEPKYMDVWITENAMLAVGLPALIFLGWYFKLSNLSYTLITIFLCMHIVGAHYSYAETPFGYVLQDWLGSSRNMYDRLVHLSFGLLMAFPIREIFFRLAKTKGFWAYYIPLDLIISLSALFELIEWAAVELSGFAAGADYLGMQGDIFDAQKDIAMATLGGSITLFIIGVLNWIFSREFRSEVKQSFKIESESVRPEGEVEVAKVAVRKAKDQGRKIRSKSKIIREKRKKKKQDKKNKKKKRV